MEPHDPLGLLDPNRSETDSIGKEMERRRQARILRFRIKWMNALAARCSTDLSALEASESPTAGATAWSEGTAAAGLGARSLSDPD